MLDHATDWLSRMLAMVPVAGQLDHRCFLAAPWRIEYGPSPPGTIPYHIVLGGSVTIDMPDGGSRRTMKAGDVVLLTDGAAHFLHDGSGAPPRPNRDRPTLNLLVSENDGTGERIDMLCGTFLVSPAHERMLRRYLPPRLVVGAPEHSAQSARPGTIAQLTALVALMRAESSEENLGGMAMLNALSTAMFALVLRLASETAEPAHGLLALAANPRLAPALTAMLNDPAHAWTLPQLARLCNLSRATFIRHFQDRLGCSASDLLTDIRMIMAADALGKSELSTGAVADGVGYQSEAAFQRAFKNHMGLTPAQYRRSNAPVGSRPIG